MKRDKAGDRKDWVERSKLALWMKGGLHWSLEMADLLTVLLIARPKCHLNSKPQARIALPSARTTFAVVTGFSHRAM